MTTLLKPAPLPPILTPIAGDNAPQITAAIAAGTARLLAGAFYPINSPINIVDKTGYTFTGSGATIAAMASMPKHANMILAQNCRGLTIDSLGLDGNGKIRGAAAGDDSQSISLNWCKNVLISAVGFWDSVADEIFLWGGWNCPMGPCEHVHITRCAFTRPGRNAISPVNARFTLIDYCTFDDINGSVPSSGIDAEPNDQDPLDCCTDLIVEHNTFTNVYRAVYCQNKGVTAPAGLTFTHNTHTGGMYGCQTEWACGTIAHNIFSKLRSFPICTGNYPAGKSQSRIFDNTEINCPASVIDPGDFVGAN